MKAVIHVELKTGVLDPQGKAVAHALNAIGYDEVADARVGKVITLDLADCDRQAAEARVREMCEKLLANTVIEKFEIALED